MMLHMSCTRLDASRDRIEVTGILTNDGHGCGCREKFSVANGKSRKVGRKNFWSLMGSREKWVAKNFSRQWVVVENWVAKNLLPS